MGDSAGDAGRWLSTDVAGGPLVPDDMLFVRPLESPDECSEGPAPCDAGLPTGPPRPLHPEPFLGSLEGGGTTAPSASTSSARFLVRGGSFGTILKE